MHTWEVPGIRTNHGRIVSDTMWRQLKEIA